MVEYVKHERWQIKQKMRNYTLPLTTGDFLRVKLKC